MHLGGTHVQNTHNIWLENKQYVQSSLLPHPFYVPPAPSWSTLGQDTNISIVFLNTLWVPWVCTRYYNQLGYAVQTLSKDTSWDGIYGRRCGLINVGRWRHSLLSLTIHEVYIHNPWTPSYKIITLKWLVSHPMNDTNMFGWFEKGGCPKQINVE